VEADTYDVVVIGAGPVGENVADRVVRGELSAAIVERELVGGECSYGACMPTKALLRSTAALPGASEAVTGDPDVAAVLRRRDSFASYWKDDGQASWLDSVGIPLYRGHGRISSERVVEVTGEDGVVTSPTARHAVVVATGSAALLPDIPGPSEVAPTAMSRPAGTGGGGTSTGGTELSTAVRGRSPKHPAADGR
jgi:pyruvate/2-oxoglutarate dehydrogenase complex dihydrolipoamide dehydrogenase (E3) component